MNRHDKRAGDKVELIETGSLSLLDMSCIQAEMYAVDPMDNRVMRLDLCADTEGVDVQWYWNNLEIKGKRSARHWLTGEKSETFAVGKKPHQLRVYDKTGHRKALLRSENRRIKGDAELCALTFEERWGYPASNVVTRVERQIGGKAEIEAFGYSKVGYLRDLWKADPFHQLTFPAEVRRRKLVEKLTVKDQIFAEWIRSQVLSEGVIPTKNLLYRMAQQPGLSEKLAARRALRVWDQFKSFALPTAESKVTRIDLLKSYRASIMQQLQKAA